MPLYKALDLGAELPADVARRYQRYRIMKEMGWTIEEYNRAPAALVAEVAMFLTTENRLQADRLEARNA